jgi:TonB family protein
MRPNLFPLPEFAVAEAEAKYPGQDGYLTVEIEIDGSGCVSRVSITEDQLKNQDLADTFLRVIKKMRFQPPADGQPAKVTYRFELKNR